VEPFVNNLFDDLQDGLILLQAMDKVRPGLVDWKKVNKAPVASKFKKVENTNYVIVLGKSLKFTLVGIQGSDITDGQKTLTLGLVWQLMREHVIQTLKSLSKSGVDITEADIIAWANAAVKRGGKYSSITQFKDSNLRSGVFLLDLLNGIKKGIVNYELVSPGHSGMFSKSWFCRECLLLFLFYFIFFPFFGALLILIFLFAFLYLDDDAKLNAKYAISIARKLGATIFVLPEDIVEVKPKMVCFVFFYYLPHIYSIFQWDRNTNTGMLSFSRS
jgi:plastin-1